MIVFISGYAQPKHISNGMLEYAERYNAVYMKWNGEAPIFERPLCLVGHSFGGWRANELADELEVVDYMLLLDAVSHEPLGGTITVARSVIAGASYRQRGWPGGKPLIIPAGCEWHDCVLPRHRHNKMDSLPDIGQEIDAWLSSVSGTPAG